MPLYEHICPQHGRFESLQDVNLRLSAPCPKCGTKSKLVPSRFSWKWFNKFTVDGEGFTSRYVRNEEALEMSQENREK